MNKKVTYKNSIFLKIYKLYYYGNYKCCKIRKIIVIMKNAFVRVIN